MSPPAKQGVRHIAISGAGSGIGRAIALRLAQTGAALSLFARHEARLQETASACEDAGAASVVVRACDVTDKVAVGSAFADFVGEQGPLHSLVANSGIGGANHPGECDRFEELVSVNLIGTYTSLRAAVPHLAPGPAPRQIVVISSILARIGVAHYSGYCASKAGLLGLVRAMAMELAPSNVLVNAICPGWVDTDMATQGLDDMARGMKITREAALALAMADVPLGHMAAPEDVAGVVAWLLSAEARHVTGQALDLNGGSYMN